MEINLSRQKALRELQENLGLNFLNLELLNQALTHSSKEPIFHNERLEFLGDAVLEIIVAEYLFCKYPHLKEGTLSKLRAMIVSGESLSRCAREAKIEKYLLVGKNQEKIRSQDSLLANAYEAVIGAIYLDKGLKEAHRFIVDFLIKEEEIQEMKDFKSDLQEYTQSFYKSLPQYEIVKKIGPEHRRKFKVKVKIGQKVLGEGWGFSKKKAEKKAAQSAWKEIENGFNK